MNTTRTVLPEIKLPGADSPVSSSAAYLTELNREQRAAVEHGVGEGASKPLLVIAGAGSGKTKNSGASGCASDRQWRRSSPNSSPDVFSTIGDRAHAACTADLYTGIGDARRCPDRRLDVGWYVPWHWRTALTGVGRSDRSQPHVHDP